MAEKPNVIFILLDDQGWGDAKALGHPYLKTPSIDRLVREGTRFHQFYVNNPVCSPSRTAFMTGHYPARHRVHQHFAGHQSNLQRGMPDWLDPDLTTVCDIAKTQGYATAHFGKWHLGHNAGAPNPSEYGIDDHRTYTHNSSGPGWGELEQQRYFRARSTGLFVDETIRFIRAHKNQPFYVNLWTLVPHALLDPTPEELARYEKLQVDASDFPSWMRSYVRNTKHSTQQMRVYCAAMTGLDLELGRLLDFLDQEKLASKTLIVLSSDNGPEDYRVGNAANAGMGYPGPLRARKRSLYEGGIRTPLLVRWPGHVPAGRADDTSVLTAVDFLPTLASITGAKALEIKSDGEDVSDILLGQARSRRTPIYWEWRGDVTGNPAYRPPRLAVRDGRWKLFCNFDGSGVELYDIPADREERNDCAAAEPEVVARLKIALLAWKKTLPTSPAAIGKQ